MKRTMQLSPQLEKGGHEILATLSGLRPSRHGGNRIEKINIAISGKERILVHNYGAGGTGFQAGYGMAQDSVATCEEELGQIHVHRGPSL